VFNVGGSDTIIFSLVLPSQIYCLFLFLAFFQKIISNVPLENAFKKIDPQLGAVVIGAKVTRHGAGAIGAKLLAHVGVGRRRGADVAETMAP
jgi:hypothetical protein